MFGSKCFYVVPKNKVKKLDPRSREAIFLWYLENTKGYKLWDIESEKCVMSRDVTFREHDHRTKKTLPASNTFNRGGEQESRLQSAKVEESVEAEVADDALESEQEQDFVPNLELRGEVQDQTQETTQAVEPQNEAESGHDDEMHDCQEGESTQDSGNVQPSPPVRRSNRTNRTRRKPGEWWKPSANIALSARVVPVSYKKATLPENIDFWKPGIDKEHDCLLRNKTWKLVKRTQSMHVLPSKYVFRVKNRGPKARVVALGCNQLFGIDYLETFAPVVKLTTLRVLFALIAIFDLECDQMDVVTAFLNGDLDQEIYMMIPEGLRTPENEDMVCKLQKSLYGLKQSPRQWYAKIDDFLVGTLKFVASMNDPCLYVRKSESTILIIALYVDDLLIVGNIVSNFHNWAKLTCIMVISC